jgi:hypothetical protein
MVFLDEWAMATQTASMSITGLARTFSIVPAFAVQREEPPSAGKKE